jgi:hypothetical protein
MNGMPVQQRRKRKKFLKGLICLIGLAGDFHRLI